MPDICALGASDGSEKEGRGAGMLRRRLDLALSPLQVTRSLRGRPGLVSLIGAWCGGGALIACDPVEVLSPDADPFAALDVSIAGAEAGVAFGGGWIGFWGYQLGRRVERLSEAPPRPSPQREHWFGRYEWVLRQDVAGAWWWESLLSDAHGERAFETVRNLLTPDRSRAQTFDLGNFVMTPSPAAHVKAVSRTRDRIRAGDLLQANLCVRLEAAFAGDPLDVFCTGVEALAPPYAAFLETGEYAVASFSPELFLRRQGRSVLTSPIKGTGPADDDPAALAASTKDRAENVMIVDLMRNDLGRVCEPGTVQAPEVARVEPRAGVLHLISDVTGRLRAGVSDGDLLRACFPPGSVTGAPKVRAMELINELETSGRELYTGAIGYVSPVAGLEANVVIRTVEFAGGRAWMGVGGGIVADSDPQAELVECWVKAAPILSAIGGELAEGSAPLGFAAAAASAPGHLPWRTVIRRPDPTLGVFTTVLVHDGTPVLREAHAQRLCRSAAVVLGLCLDPVDVVNRLDAESTKSRCDSRLRVTARPDGRLEFDLRPVQPTSGWRMVPVVVPGGLGEHKWVDRAVLAGVLPDDVPDATELLLMDSDGTVLETGRGSLFLVCDDGVHTPRTDGRILPGIARSEVLRVLAEHNLPVYEHDITVADLADAAEVFLTNAVRAVVPVESCEGVGSWPAGPTTQWLRRVINECWRPGSDPSPSLLTRSHVHVSGVRLLLIDNYDSFSYNLAQYAEELGSEVTVIRNDDEDIEHLLEAFTSGAFTHLLISPGPGRPEGAGVSTGLVRALNGTVPVLGVCLGHQCIGQAYGARTVRARRPVHGKPALVHHDGEGVFTGLDGPIAAGRYHSLVVEDLPHELLPTAWTADGTLMGLRHRTQPVEGIQIHPESILTPRGHDLLGNFLADPGRSRQSSWRAIGG